MERPKDVFHRRAPRAAAGQGDGVRGNVRRAGGHDRHLRRHRAGVSPRGRSPRGIRRVVVGRLPRRRAAPRVRHSGAFYLTLVPIRPRWRGERRFSRTFSPGASLRPGSLAFNARPRRLSPPLLTPLNSTPTSSLCIQRPSDHLERGGGDRGGGGGGREDRRRRDGVRRQRRAGAEHVRARVRRRVGG
eukprot:30738-Pelagococcus_subviridis.AAC.6